MDNAKQQIVESLVNTNNILVTVSSNPSVDELSAALGLTLILDKLEKRATAIYSGVTPPAITFLEPEKTFEGTADSLRDFIIALNKEKADHLRYKVDGDVVKIFITPYKTTLSQADLEFSEGDYNVEMIVALGVKDQDHLDNALVAHGKILHDAKVVTITAGKDTNSKLGSTDWHDDAASSLSEMITSLVNSIKSEVKLLDTETSTALLTGIVSATDRFSNDHTSSQVMTLAAQLMAAGANQQLIAAKLQEGNDIGVTAFTKGTPKEGLSKDGSELVIARDASSDTANGEKVIEPPVADAPSAAISPDDAAQLELEKQLAGLTAPSTGTMADIEKELQDAATKPEGEAAAQPSAEPAPVTNPELQATPVDETPITAPSDTAMPGFEPAIPAPSGDQPSAEPVVIESHNGPVGIVSPDQLPAMNGTMAGDGDDTIIDPFNTPGVVEQHEGATITPDASSTYQPLTFPAPPPAVVNAAAESAPPPVVVSAPEALNMPPLPPLPPLPSDVSIPPLPPPPPPPVFEGQPAGSMPAGAVSGDIFGDANAATTPAPAPTAPAAPGQFKIPGQ